MAFNPVVWFNIRIDNREIGLLSMELFAEEVPYTAENFRALCTGEKGVGLSGKQLCYSGSSIHRVYQNRYLEGGDFTHGDGTGGESIYGESFADENFVHTLDSRGMLFMANRGPNTNKSVFGISLSAMPDLNSQVVVFGKVIAGDEVLSRIEGLSTRTGKTTSSIVIDACGQL